MKAISKRCQRAVQVGFVLSIALIGQSAHAQEVAHPLQLSFGANAVSYERSKTSIDGNSATATNTELGPVDAGFTLGVGFRPSESWLVGLSVNGSYARSTDGRDETPPVTRGAYAVMPRLEYWFAPGESVSPYAGATLGLRGTSASAGPDAKSSTTDFAIGGLAGLRIFAAPGFSIDPDIALLALSGSGDSNGSKVDRSGFAFALGLSFSGWIATEPATPVAPTLATPNAAPKAEKTPETTPPPNESAEPDGSIRSEIWLSDGRQLRIIGRPIQESNSVLVTLLNGNTSAQARPCTEVNLVVDGRAHAIVPGPRRIAGSTAVQWLMSPAVLHAIGEAKQSAQLEQCGVSSDILIENRAVLADFYREFRSTAERYGRTVPDALAD